MLRGNSQEMKNAFQPFVSIMVPTYNEKKVIEERIPNLVGLDYPKKQFENRNNIFFILE